MRDSFFGNVRARILAKSNKAGVWNPITKCRYDLRLASAKAQPDAMGLVWHLKNSTHVSCKKNFAYMKY